MTKAKVLLLVSVILMMGCGRISVSEDTQSSLTLSVKSDESIPVNSLQTWAFYCDAQGNVTQTENIGYASSVASQTVSLKLDGKSRYYILMTGVNLPSMFNEGTSFSTLSTATFLETPDETIYTNWTVVDLMGDVANVPIEVFPTCGRIRVNISKETDAMTLRIDEIRLLSNNAPTQNTFFSAMTSEQIRNGGLTSGKWNFSGVSIPLEATSISLASSVDIVTSRQSLCDKYVYEHSAGWTDLKTFRESGWSTDPSKSDPECNGYYLSVSYTYAVCPEMSLDSDQAITVQKYIPLPPVCRGNEYRYDIRINLDEIIVFGSTEVSEEIGGSW